MAFIPFNSLQLNHITSNRHIDESYESTIYESTIIELTNRRYQSALSN